MFKEYIGKLKASVGKERTKFILENAIFLVVAGSDDIANTYFTLRVRQLQYDVPAYTDLMVNGATDFIKVNFFFFFFNEKEITLIFLDLYQNCNDIT